MIHNKKRTLTYKFLLRETDTTNAILLGLLCGNEVIFYNDRIGGCCCCGGGEASRALPCRTPIGSF